MHRLITWLLFVILSLPVYAGAQSFTATIPRVTIATNTDRCTPGRQMLPENGAIELKVQISTAHRTDPSRIVTLRLEEADSDAGPWRGLVSGRTWGSPNNDIGTDPSIRTTAPIAGRWARACGRTEAQAVSLGVQVNIYDEARPVNTPPPHNSVAFDDAEYVSGTGVGALTISAGSGNLTVAGANRLCMMAVSNGQAAITVSNTTCATVSGTSAGARATATGQSVHLWYAVAPATGSQDATVNFSDTFGTSLALKAVTFTGVDQSTPLSDYGTASGTTTPCSVTIANAVAGGMIFDGCQAATSGTLTVGADQTARGVAQNGLSASTQDGASGGVMTWALQFNGAWAQAGVRIVEAASGAETFGFRLRLAQ